MSENYQMLVIGCSAGGLQASREILSALPKQFSLSVIIAQHLAANAESMLVELLADRCALPVEEIQDKESIRPGRVYVIPPDYHAFVERDLSVSLSQDERINYARPSIDVLFESAAEALGDKVIALVLTGANQDGAQGAKSIRERGGYVIVQSPETAEARTMPEAAIRLAYPQQVVPLHEITIALLRKIGGKKPC